MDRFCSRTAGALAVLAAGLLVLGGVQDVRADLNPPGCTDTGPLLLIRILDPNGVSVPQGTAFYEGTTISFIARLSYDDLPQCGYEGGTLCIETPEGDTCDDVTPGGGIPLLCDIVSCNPLGVGQVLSDPKPYVVDRNDIDPPPSDCPDENSIRSRARYQNGSAFGDPDPNEVVFPINADTPACIVALFCGDGETNGPEVCDPTDPAAPPDCREDCTLPVCGDGIVDPGETCDPPGDPAGNNGNLCREDCSVCGDGIVNGGEACDDGNGIDDDECSNACEPPIPDGDDKCRTPGFWGTHAGVEKTRSVNITQELIDEAGGLSICGETILSTSVDDAASAVEAICVPIKQGKMYIALQLARQLTAASLNCVIGGFGPDCFGSPLYGDVFASCNDTCADWNSGGEVPRSDIVACIAEIDCLNNGKIFEDGICDGSSGCHEELLVNEALALDFEPPGPAGSSKACNDANKTKCTVIKPHENQCFEDSDED